MKKGIPEEVEALGAVLAAVNGFEPEQQTWIFSSAISKLNLSGLSLNGAQAKGVEPLVPGPVGSGKVPTPKEFMRAKNPQSDVQRVLCLGYYLTQHRGQPHFKTKDLSKLNLEAAGAPIGNVSQAMNNATKQSHYLAPAGGGNKQVTSHGDEVVVALPDQAAVKLVEENRPKRRKAKKPKVSR